MSCNTCGGNKQIPVIVHVAGGTNYQNFAPCPECALRDSVEALEKRIDALESKLEALVNPNTETEDCSF